MLLVLNHKILEAEGTITKIFSTSNTTEEVSHISVVTLSIFFHFTLHILSCYQLNCVIQKGWISYYWLSCRTSQYKQWCDFHVRSHRVGGHIIANLRFWDKLYHSSSIRSQGLIIRRSTNRKFCSSFWRQISSLARVAFLHSVF